MFMFGALEGGGGLPALTDPSVRQLQIQACSEGTGKVAVGVNALDMWVMDLSKLSFSKVNLGDSGDARRPGATLLSAMVVADEFGGYKTPLVLAGGADVSCARLSPPCTMPMPSNEIWVMDAARQETGSGTRDKMAELDGDDDILQIVLPAWCDSPSMMSVLWVDLWLLVTSAGEIKTMIAEALSGAVPRLRWYMQGSDSGNYIKLVLSPGDNEKPVKTWGPLDPSFVGGWHHLAMTLRFARQYSKTSSDPAIILTQAFLFLDGAHVEEVASFPHSTASSIISFHLFWICGTDAGGVSSGNTDAGGVSSGNTRH